VLKILLHTGGKRERGPNILALPRADGQNTNYLKIISMDTKKWKGPWLHQQCRCAGERLPNTILNAALKSITSTVRTVEILRCLGTIKRIYILITKGPTAKGEERALCNITSWISQSRAVTPGWYRHGPFGFGIFLVLRIKNM